jgi:SAM-dependent methyltransferase
MTIKDPWLQPWLTLVCERAGHAPVLELGCGKGQDTATLVQAGCSVVAIDLSASAIAQARQAVPQAEFHVKDIRQPFPLRAAQAGVVIASLSLHYFPWPDTLALVQRIRSTLKPEGLLLCRLNSTHDHHYGASGHTKIDDNYYVVDGEPKRFFDRTTAEALFADGWHTLSIAEQVIDRYAKPKVVWELVAEKTLG